MRIAVVNEISSCQKHADILAALDGFGHEVFNAGMASPEQQPQLTYIHTGLISALLLGTDACDLVVGGCGTGQGYLNSVMQYPNVFAGLIHDPLDAWLFSQINGGNCISLPLNKGYGWGADINLRYVFEKLFCDPMGNGYPESRRESQAESRRIIKILSKGAHKELPEILTSLPEHIVQEAFASQAFLTAFTQRARNLSLRDSILEQVVGVTG